MKIIKYIFEYIPDEDLINLSQVNKLCYNILDDNNFWRNKFRRRFHLQTKFKDYKYQYRYKVSIYNINTFYNTIDRIIRKVDGFEVDSILPKLYDSYYILATKDDLSWASNFMKNTSTEAMRKLK